MKTNPSNKKTFLAQLSLVALITIVLPLSVQSQTTPPQATHKWGHTIKSKDTISFVRVFEGAVHIAPHQTDTEFIKNFASVGALADALLFVQKGIVTENMNYIFADNWDEWPDYVFDADYKPLSLDDLEIYIKENKHLPEVISQIDVKNKGVNDREMSVTFLKKIEELTLYTIEQHKAIKEQKEINASLLQKLNDLEKKVNYLSNNK